MNKQELANANLERFLEKEKARRKSEVLYILSFEQLVFVEKVLNHKTIPFVYTIYTRKLVYKDIRNKGAILKQVYSAYKNNKPVLHCTLTHSEKEILRKNNIIFVPYQHIIILH